MNCKKCGSLIRQGEMFCSNCGTKVENQINNTVIQTNNVIQNSTQLNNNINQINNTVEPLNSNINFYEQPKEESVNVIKNNTNLNNEVINQNINQANNTVEKTSNDVKSLIGLIIGIVSIILAFIIKGFVIPIAIAGLVLAIIGKAKGAKKVLGILLNILAIFLSIIVIIVSAIIGLVNYGNSNSNTSLNKQTFYGEGYSLEYGSKWNKTKASGKDALSYSLIKDSYLVQIGNSKLTDTASCDFEEYDCKDQIHDKFYEYWKKDAEENDLEFYEDSYGFRYLDDDIYYATYEYGKSYSDLSGKFYLLISKENNNVISFMTKVNHEFVDQMDNKTLELLQEIELDDLSLDEEDNDDEDEENTIYDDEMYEILDSMSNWNRYSELRKDNLGKVKDINGGWRILSDSETYYEFKNGEFWWYKSVNDLNDNYWYGTTNIVTGKDGLKLLGLDENKIDTIVSNSKGNVNADDIYAVVLTPTKIISDGVDKSSTNIPENSKWDQVWIIVDHGNEGIEAQVLHLDTADATYYFKYKD